MSNCKRMVAAFVLALLGMPIAAQGAGEPESAKEAERVVQLERAEQAEVRMREAEMELEAAAQRIAELSAQRLVRVGELEREWFTQSNRAVLGITIGSDDENQGEPVEGVDIIGITPGGAAEDAGLRSGDVIVAINGDSMSSSNGDEAMRKLLDFMHGVEEGDVLEIDYLRDGNNSSVEVTPKLMAGAVIDFRLGDGALVAPMPHLAPGVKAFHWVERYGGHGFGEMEMVELNESLGRYFGTDSGLLIVKAPKDNAFLLQDGDVIKSIDGRKPKDLYHAVRILSSYESGETVNIEIMRDKREKTLTVEVPDDRVSLIGPDITVAPVLGAAPALDSVPAVRFVPNVKVVRKVSERT